MTTSIEDELWSRALQQIPQQAGLVEIHPSIVQTWAASTLEGRAAAEIARLKAGPAMATQLASSSAGRAAPECPRYRTAIVACARWEADNILEWVTYHRSLGFEHIYVYCNDDDPAELYEKLCALASGEAPFVTFLHYALPGLQTAMYKHFLRTKAEEVEWLLFLDIDEFVVLKQHTTVDAFIHEYEHDADAIYLNWVMFGNNGFVDRPLGSILRQYIRRDRFVNPYTKVLTRVASLNIRGILDEAASGFWHDWKEEAGTLRRVNVLGEDMTGYYDNFPDGARRRLDEGDRQHRILAIAAIYHFAFQSERDIDRRIQRGVGGDFGGQIAFKNVADRGEVRQFLGTFNQVEDVFLRDYWAALIAGSRRDSVIPPAPGENIALGKNASQSSRCQWSRGNTPEEDAAGAVSGVISGHGAFHTDGEDCPWWSVDLSETFRLREMRLYNRMDTVVFARRTCRFRIQVALDGAPWQTVFVKDDDSVFGGIDGKPFIWRPETYVAARCIRIQLLGSQFMHLDQVEVYGDRV